MRDCGAVLKKYGLVGTQCGGVAMMVPPSGTSSSTSSMQ